MHHEGTAYAVSKFPCRLKTTVPFGDYYGVIFEGCGTPKLPARGFHPLGTPNICVTMVKVELCLWAREINELGVVGELVLRKKSPKKIKVVKYLVIISLLSPSFP